MNILIAPNAFKNSLSAEAAAESIRAGLSESGLPGNFSPFPVGDGGDGTASLIVKNKQGVFSDTLATDPIGRKIKSTVGFIDAGQTAVIGMSEISGLKLLRKDELDPLRASSFGTGELMKNALDKKAGKIILCIGGSATMDGGCGILQALGIRFLDANGADLQYFPFNGTDLHDLDLSGLDRRIPETRLVILCDVDNILLGKKGAAYTFGPQKGASEKDLLLIEKSLGRLRDVILHKTGKDLNAIRHGGAAGGTAAGLSGMLDAELVSGSDYFLELSDFDRALNKSQLLITGEGNIDRQTLEGKAPYAVALRARNRKIPVIGFTGRVETPNDPLLSEYFPLLLGINPPDSDLETAMALTANNLHQTAFHLGKQLHANPDLRSFQPDSRSS